MGIILGGNEFNYSFEFKKIRNLEQAIGSIYGFVSKARSFDISVADVVNIYYYLQKDSGYSQDQIMAFILKDGTNVHSMHVQKILAELLGGSAGETPAKKGEEVQEA